MKMNVNLSALYSRCNETKEFTEYMEINNQIFTANDKKIFNMTGCLSMCNKYAYTAQQLLEMQYVDAPDSNTTTLTLQLYYSNVEHELREQVNLPEISATVTFEYIPFQYIIYDINALTADVGGYLGLLLGQSIYGLYEIMTQWLGYRIMKCGKQLPEKCGHGCFSK